MIAVKGGAICGASGTNLSCGRDIPEPFSQRVPLYDS